MATSSAVSGPRVADLVECNLIKPFDEIAGYSTHAPDSRRTPIMAFGLGSVCASASTRSISAGQADWFVNRVAKAFRMRLKRLEHLRSS